MRLRVFEKKRDFIRYTLPLYIVAVGEAGGTGIETVHFIVGGNVDQTIGGRFDFIDAPWVEAVAFYGRDAVVVFVQNISSAQSAEPDFPERSSVIQVMWLCLITSGVLKSERKIWML